MGVIPCDETNEGRKKQQKLSSDENSTTIDSINKVNFKNKENSIEVNEQKKVINKNKKKQTNPSKEINSIIEHQINGKKKPKIKIAQLYTKLLLLHNNERKAYNFLDLKNTEYLNKLAQKYADNYQEIKEYNNFSSNDDLYAINYITFKGDDISEILSIFKGWIKEKVFFENKKINKFNSEAKHYTQIIWKSTKNIGFGYSKQNNENIFVIFYSPPGNIFDKFKENTN